MMISSTVGTLDDPCHFCHDWILYASGLSTNYNETDFCNLIFDYCEQHLDDLPSNDTLICDELRPKCHEIYEELNESVTEVEICEKLGLCKEKNIPTPEPSENLRQSHIYGDSGNQVAQWLSRHKLSSKIT
ncbi:unnamed protein product, partial [Mesorhabditis belari]|uniref:Uncharacterized protein n=1 Tax=Mesorhabditis belari TaxID=2138241 RepID=A0AAF3J964_9BILA